MTELRILDTASRRGHIVKLVDSENKTLVKYAIQKHRGVVYLASFRGGRLIDKPMACINPESPGGVDMQFAVELATRECERIRIELGGRTGGPG